jgi:Tol biopolymer transport system component
VRGSTVFAQRFDPGRLTLEGEPRPLVDQIQVSGRAGSGIAGAYTASDSGVLAYQTSAEVRSQLVWFDRAGRQLGRVGDPADHEDVALSPDASHAAVSVRDPASGTRDLWLYDLGRGLRERFTYDPSDEIAPTWSPDGTELIYTSTRGGGISLIRTRVRGSGGGEQTLPGDGLGLGRFAANWSRDGHFLVYIAGGRIIARSDLWIAPLSGSGKPYPFLETPFIETHGRFSPNGRWLAFTSNTSGVPEVYVTAFPSRGERTRVSAAGGGWPRWGDDGKEIVYVGAGGQMMSAAVAGDGPAFRVDRVGPLFTVRMRPSTRLDAYLYDMSSDGQRFLVSGFVDDIKPGAITLVVNWPQELER